MISELKWKMIERVHRFSKRESREGFLLRKYFPFENIPREIFRGSISTKVFSHRLEFSPVTRKCESIKHLNSEKVVFEKYFAKIRTKAGLDTLNRAKHQQNDITLHSLRAYFIK